MVAAIQRARDLFDLQASTEPGANRRERATCSAMTPRRSPSSDAAAGGDQAGDNELAACPGWRTAPMTGAAGERRWSR